MTIERRHVGKRLSELVINRASGTAYLAGQVADDPKADITGQTRQVLAQIDDLLSRPAPTRRRSCRRRSTCPTWRDFAAMNAVWETWVVPGADACARHRAGEARRARVQDRDPGRRGGRLIAA